MLPDRSEEEDDELAALLRRTYRGCEPAAPFAERLRDRLTDALGESPASLQPSASTHAEPPVNAYRPVVGLNRISPFLRRLSMRQRMVLGGALAAALAGFLLLWAFLDGEPA